MYGKRDMSKTVFRFYTEVRVVVVGGGREARAHITPLFAQAFATITRNIREMMNRLLCYTRLSLLLSADKYVLKCEAQKLTFYACLHWLLVHVDS